VLGLVGQSRWFIHHLMLASPGVVGEGEGGLCHLDRLPPLPLRQREGGPLQPHLSGHVVVQLVLHVMSQGELGLMYQGWSWFLHVNGLVVHLISHVMSQGELGFMY